LTRYIRSGARAVQGALRVAAWLAETLWLGVTTLWAGARFITRASRIFSTTSVCPRGHRLENYGVWSCSRCQARFEGHAFDPCPTCGARARYISCPTCRLAVHDPLR
jgi:hypothetical protein